MYCMDFKVHRVSKVKPPATLPGPTENRLNDKGNSSQLKGSANKPKLPGRPPGSTNTVGEPDHNQNNPKNSVYAYAGVEFRPLQITDEGGISTAIAEGRKSSSPKPSQEPKNEILAYEEVIIPSGNFDKLNPENILTKSHDSGGSNDALAAFTADMQQSTHDENKNAEVSNNVARKKPPPMPKPYAKSKENIDAPDGGKKKPPIPKPYGACKEEFEETPQSPGESSMDAVYAVVNKPPKPQNQVNVSEPEEEKEEEPPPLPNRPNFEAEEDLTKSQEELIKDEPQEKTSKGSNLIKTIKKHIRQKSDGSQPKKSTSTDEPKGPEEATSSNGKPSKSVKAYLVTDIVSQPSTKMFGEPEMYESVTDGREEEKVSGGPSDLPDGWQEVKDSGGTYYWHVASGTTQWEKPKKLESSKESSSKPSTADQTKPKPKPELKTVTSFPVHSMGWIELEESQVAPHNMSDTIAECISNLARERKDLWKTSETWGGGKDLRLLLESDNLKLVDGQTKATLLVQPISKMRVWGAGRDEQKDFAYVARDQTSGKHRCHVFRCHGNISGRAIHNKLHEMCNKILAEKKKARESEQQNGATKQWSDILNTKPKPSLVDQAGFNEKPLTESKKSFSGKFIGKVEVPRPTGIDVVHKAIDVAITSRDPQTWRTCLIEITVSSVRTTDCLSQVLIAENRIKFVSFIGVAKDVRFCGYISSGEQTSSFLCHVFQCIPNAASFTKALQEACRLRLQSCLDTNPVLAEKLFSAEAEKSADRETNKSGAGIKGFLGKLANQAKLGVPRRSSLEPSVNTSEPQVPPTEFLIKYFGCQPVSVGTGPVAIKEAVEVAKGTTLQIRTINVNLDFITLDDSVKSGISCKYIPLERISYCALASDRVHFGLIESQGGGKFICHVFAEHKVPVDKVVEAINKVL